ncbi:hypothetical protein HG531_010559 [Fusarium graminearum]|nr:hypothetical protein HG531_010559 [Fusarium graminearum]
MVVNSSTKSSLLVDQGSCTLDDLSSVTAGGGVISERVRRDGASRGLEAGSPRGTSAESSAAEATSKTTTSAAKTAAASESSTKSSAHATAKATPTTETHTGSTTGVAVLANLDDTALPIVAIELSNSVASIVGALEDNDTRSLRAAIRSDMDVGSNYGTGSSCATVRLQHHGVLGL